MIRYNKHILIFLLLTIIFIPILANAEDPGKTEFAVYPKFSYGDETGFSGGPITFYRFYFKNQKLSESKSSIQIQSDYSEKKQFEMQLSPLLHIPGGVYQFSSDIKYKYWPSDFYGIGNSTDDDESEKFTPKEFYIKLNLRKELNNFYFGSLLYDFSWFDIVKTEDDGILETQDITGGERYLISGLGVEFGKDTRDSESYPTQGIFAAISAISFNKYLGSDYDFTRYQLDLRGYKSLDTKQVLAGQILTTQTVNLTPFNELAQLSDGLRTIKANQSIDNLMIVSRIEYRVFLWEQRYLDRIGFVAFGGIGNVYHQTKELTFSDLNYNFGGGLRISLFTTDRFNLRIDYGRNRDGGSIAIGAGEEF